MSQNGDESRKQVGTLFLDLSELEKNTQRANEQLKSIGGGVSLDLTSIVEKQVKQQLEIQSKAVEKRTKNIQKNAQQMKTGFNGMADGIVSATKVITTASGDALDQITQVVKGKDRLDRTVSQVYKNGNLTKVSFVDTDLITQANTLYTEQSRLLREQKKQRLDLAKTDVGTRGYLDRQREVAETENQIKANKVLIATYPDEIKQKTKLKRLAQEEKTMNRELGKSLREIREERVKSQTQAQQIEQANALYDAQTEDLKLLAKLTHDYYAAIGKDGVEDILEEAGILSQIISLRQEEIDQVDEQIVAKSKLAKLNQDLSEANKSVETTQIEYANKLYFEQAENLERLVLTYEGFVNAQDNEQRDLYAFNFDQAKLAVQMKQMEIDLVDDEIAKKSELNRLDQESLKAANQMNNIAQKKADDDERARIEAENQAYSAQKNSLSELLAVRKKLSTVQSEEAHAYYAERLAQLEDEIALGKTKVQDQEHLNELVETEKKIRAEMAELDYGDASKRSKAEQVNWKELKSDLEDAYSTEEKALKSKLQLTKELQKAETDTDRANILKRIGEVDEDIKAAKTRIKNADARLKAETKLSEHLYKRMQLEKEIADVEPKAKAEEQAKAYSAELKNNIALLQKKYAIERKLQGATAEESAEVQPEYYENKRALRESDKMLASLREQGVEIAKNNALEQKRLGLLENIREVQKAPSMTDDQANKLADRTLQTYKELLAKKDELDSAEKGSSRWQTLNEEVELLKRRLAHQLEVVNSVEDEVYYRTKLKALQGNMDFALEENQAEKPLQDAENAYKRLKEANKSYLDAAKKGRTKEKEYWKDVAEEQTKIIENSVKITSKLSDENKAKKRILKISDGASKSNQKTKTEIDEINKKLQTTEKQVDNVVDRAEQWLINMVLLNGLKTLWKNATTYVQEYYDKLNEVRIVTGATEEEAARMGKTYLSMAKEMSVSSQEIAEAAVEFWRQGLGEAEVNARLVETTKYAKIAGLEFDEAAELVTAATNSMSLGADKVVDVFSYLGDASASGADEIGTAMQKASAAADEFGQSFEWLGSYIATISEKTRQAPEVIGTSINSILARLHSIKQTGYNSEDETTINDIAKALNKIGVSLMDNENKWYSLDEIFNQIADRWGTLDDKTRAYISTTVAGTRQQNYFLTLMSDLAKSTEGASRAMELYVGSLNAAGTASEKYAIWQESITAAQNNMKASLEELYSLVNADWMKGFYNGTAGLISNIAQGTEAMKGLNLAATILGTGLTTLGIKAKTSAGQFKALGTALKSHPVIGSALLVGGAITAITAAVGSMETAAEKYAAATQKMEEADKAISDLEEKQKKLGASFEELADKQNRTTVEEAEYNALLKEMAEISPGAKKVMDEFTAGAINQKEALEAVNNEFATLIENQEKEKRQAAQERYNNWTPSEEAKKRAKEVMVSDQHVLEGRSAEEFYDWAGHQTFLTPAMRRVEDKIESLKKIYSGEALTNALRASAEYNTSVFEATVEQLISDALSVVDSKVSILENGFLQEELFSAIMGDDGVQDWTDVQNAQYRISKIIDGILNNSITDISTLSGEKYSKTIVQSFVEKVFGKSLPEDLKREAAFFSSNELMAKTMNQLYEDLFATGLDGELISGLFDKNKSLSDQIALGVNGLFENALNEHGVDLSKYFKTVVDPKTQLSTSQSLDEEAKAMMYSLLEAGASVEDLNAIFENTASVDAYKAALKSMNVEAITTLSEEDGTFKTYKEKISEYTSDIEMFKEALDKIQAGEQIGETWTEIVDKYPDLLGISDQEKLVEELTAKIGESQQKIDEAWKDWIMSSPEVAKNASEWSHLLAGDINTLGLLYETMEEGTQKEALLAYINTQAKTAREATDDLTAYGEIEAKLLRAEGLVSSLKAIDPSAETSSVSDMLKAYDTLERQYPTLLNYERGSVEYIREAKKMVDATTASVYKEANAWGVLSEARRKSAASAANAEKAERVKELEKNTYAGGMDLLEETVKLAEAQAWKNVEEKYSSLSAEDQQAYVVDQIVGAYDKALEELDDLGLLEAMSEMFGDLGLVTEGFEGDLDAIIQKLREMKAEALDDELTKRADELRDERTLNYSESDGYRSELYGLAEAYDTSGVEGLIGAYGELSSAVRDGLGDSYKALTIAMDEANRAVETYGEDSEEAAQATKRLERELKKAQKVTGAKHFKETAKAIGDLEFGTMDVAEAMETYSDEMETVRKANEEYQAASKNVAKGAEVAAEDLENLAEFMDGVDPSWLVENWNSVGSALTNALAEGEDAFRSLQEAAVINVTGTSNVDFSDLENGIVVVDNMAQDMIDTLVAAGAFEVDTINVSSWAKVWDPKQMDFVNERLNGTYKVLKPTGKNPFKTGGGGNGRVTNDKSSGGGGSSSTDSGPSEVEKMLDTMEQIQDFQNHRRSLFSTAADMYEGRGELSNAITMYEKEIETVKEQTKTLEANVAEVEKHMLAKQKEVAAMSTSDEAYEQAASDLKALQDAHQDYTLQLMENEAAVDDLTQAIKDQQDAIRDMQIDLENEILKAIEDREELQERMLQGTIDTENEILDLLIKRYEKERDELLELAELKRDSLQEELNQLDEQLQKRKQLADEEDKLAKLQQLEAQLARISADPTRARDQLELQKQIKELREEIAWDLAEKENEAQKESLEEQITNVEDYMEYVEAYYEDLFEHPRKLVEEMSALLQRTDKEILDWLKQNSEEYREATEATQTDMVNSWQNMLDDMHGNITTHWDEVQSIIQQGDEAIIEFLKENSADYREASRLQAEAYVDEWKQKLEDLKNAFLQNAKEINSIKYNPVLPSTGSGSSGSGGSGGSSGGSAATHWKFRFNGEEYLHFASDAEARSKIDELANSNYGSVYAANIRAGATAAEANRAASFSASSLTRDALSSLTSGKHPAFKHGGLVDFTGPAWVDGTKTQPEAFLNARQTEMIGAFAKTLEQLRVSIPSMPRNMMEPSDSNRTDGIQVTGDLIVQVDKLETEEDIQNMVSILEKAMYSKLTRGAAVGGIRMR